MASVPDGPGGVNDATSAGRPSRKATDRRRGNGYIGRRPRTEGFRLRDGLAGPGLMPLAEAVDMVTAEYARLVEAGRIKNISAVAYTEIARELRDMALASGATTLADIGADLTGDYVFTPNAPRTRRPGRPPRRPTLLRRRSGARALFDTAKELGLDDRNPAADIVVPTEEEMSELPTGRVARRAAKKHLAGLAAQDPDGLAGPHGPEHRALTDREAARCREASAYNHKETRLPAATALALAGAGTGEMSYVLFGHLRLDDGLAWCPGYGRSHGRWLRLDAWAVDALRAHADHLAHRAGRAALPPVPVVWVGPTRQRRTPARKVDPHNTLQTEMGGLLRRLLKKAGLTHVPGVRPQSLPEHGAVREFARTGRLEGGAVLLGVADLNATAKVVGYDWRARNALAPAWVPGPE